ncbi:MAG: hypothetical protein FWG81_02030 [Betaproteobacteria bacterium]|nr:hypothetical protein [Betaproteobacteria bacterium]
MGLAQSSTIYGEVNKAGIYRKPNSGLKHHPSGRREGWNPGLQAGVSTVATGEGMQTPSLFVLNDRHECLSLIFARHSAQQMMKAGSYGLHANF